MSSEVVLTDQDTNFLFSLYKTYASYLNQTHKNYGLSFTNTRIGWKVQSHPLACYVQDEPANWNTYLPFVTFAYNTAKQYSTQETPFFLLFGREPILPNDIKINRRYQTFEDTIVMYSRQWETAQKLARDHLFKAQTRQKNYIYIGMKATKYNIGDFVFLKIRKQVEWTISNFSKFFVYQLWNQPHHQQKTESFGTH